MPVHRHEVFDLFSGSAAHLMTVAAPAPGRRFRQLAYRPRGGAPEVDSDHWRRRNTLMLGAPSEATFGETWKQQASFVTRRRGVSVGRRASTAGRPRGLGALC